MAQAYIGKVTYKKTGQVVRIFKSKREQLSEEALSRFVNDAKHIGTEMSDNMAGHFIVAWGWDGTFLDGMSNQADCKILTRTLPQFVEEIVRSNIITNDVQRDTAEEDPNESA